MIHHYRSWRFLLQLLCFAIVSFVLLTNKLEIINVRPSIVRTFNQSASSTVIIASCMDRTNTLEVAVRSWLSATGVSEIILVDWSSDPPILQSIPDLLEDIRVKVIVVQGEKKWILSWAYNLALRFVQPGSFMLKVDCDTILSSDFLEHHPLKKGIYYAGNWKLMETENAQHLNGIFYVESTHFIEIHGFDERIQTYGYEDTDLYLRFNASGLIFVPIDNRKVYHLDHPSNLRLSKQSIHDVSFEIEKNRILRSLVLAWNKSNEKVYFDIQNSLLRQRYYVAMRKSNVLAIESMIPPHTRDYVERRAALSVLRKFNVPMKSLTMSTAYMIKMISSYKNGKMLVVHVQHGLGNRLRAMASGMAISNRTGRHFRLIWELDEHCNVHFQELFSNNIDVWDKFEPNEISSANFERYNYIENEKGAVKYKIIDTDSLNHIYVKTSYKLNHAQAKTENMRHALSELQLQPHISAMVDSINVTGFIGVHIQNKDPRTELPNISNNTYSDGGWKKLIFWRQSVSVSLFATEISHILKKYPNQSFFLSTDSEKTRKELNNLFPGRIRSLDGETCENRSQICISFATVDLWILSRTKEILGSPYSSFSEVAGLLANKTTKYASIDFPHIESEHQTKQELSGRGDGILYINHKSTNNWQKLQLLQSVDSVHHIYEGEIPVAIFIDDINSLNKSYERLFRYIYHMNSSQQMHDGNVQKPNKLMLSAGLSKIEQLANSPFEITLYLDGSAWLCGKIGNFSKILGKHDILFSTNVHLRSKSKLSWNSDVILYKNSPIVIRFFELWKKLYLEECLLTKVKSPDNCALSSALESSNLLKYNTLDPIYSFRLGNEIRMNSNGESETLRSPLVSWPVKILHMIRRLSYKPNEICDVVNAKSLKPRVLGLTSSNQLRMYYTKEDCVNSTKNNCDTKVF